MKIPPAFRNRRFVQFWVGMFFTWMGNQALFVAISWYINDGIGAAWALGAIGIARFLPTLIFSLFSGVISDRFNRRYVMFLTQGLMGLTGLALAGFSWAGSLQLWHIYVLVVLHSIAYVFDLPARYSMTPNLVTKANLPNALSLEFLASQFGALAGAILSGNLIERFGSPAAYLASSLAFGMMLVILLLLGNVQQTKLQASRSGIDWPAIRSGVRFTIKHPLILPSMLLDFFATSLTRADSFLSYFASDILHLSAAQYGWLAAASPIGTILAGTTVSTLKGIRNQGKTLLTAIGLICAGAILFGLSQNFVLSLAALAVIGASDSVSSIIRSTIRQSHTTDELRGRMTSVNQIFFMGGPYLGDVRSGIFGGLIGIPLSVTLGGVVCLFTVGWVGWRWPQLRRYDQAA